ncbi:hypothetical protein [Microbacterium sp. 16-032]|uniref:hypothetical protein n=1 Tax=Microbacterium sp. 16-032 TaxID=3239808 RepID=UPI0034E2EE32
MTVVNVTAALTALGGSEPVTSGRITVEYLRGKDGEPATRAVGAAVTLPAPIVIAIVDGSPTEPVDVPPTDGTCYARIWVECRVPRDAGFLELPAVAIPAMGPVDITALVAVDPASFEPVTTVVTAWQLAVDQVAVMQADVTAKSVQAVEAAADAGTFAEATDFDANRAGQSAFAAGQSAASALGHKNDAKTSADTAAASATSAAGSVVAASTERQGAADERLGARQERLDAQTARTGAESAQAGAQTARTGAETARTGSEAAKTGAEVARDAAQAATFAGTTPAAGTSLDTLTTPGMYRITYGATVAQGAPFENFYGSLRVEIRAGGAVTQVARKHNALSADSGQFWQRTQTGAGWGAWFTYSSSRVGSAGEVFLRTGLTTEAQLATVGESLGTSDLNTIVKTGTYVQATGSNATLARNYPKATVGGVLEVVSLFAGSTVQRLYIAYGSGPNVQVGHYERRQNGGAWDPWAFYARRRWDQTAGRAAYEYNPEADAEQLIYGDTGWRNITTSVVNGWNANNLSIRRVGHRATLVAEGLTGAAATAQLAIALPSGFSGSGLPISPRGLFHSATYPSAVYRAFIGGVLELQFPGWTTAMPTVFGEMSWYTSDAWPTSLPGSASGTIPSA